MYIVYAYSVYEHRHLNNTIRLYLETTQVYSLAGVLLVLMSIIIILKTVAMPELIKVFFILIDLI